MRLIFEIRPDFGKREYVAAAGVANYCFSGTAKYPDRAWIL